MPNYRNKNKNRRNNNKNRNKNQSNQNKQNNQKAASAQRAEQDDQQQLHESAQPDGTGNVSNEPTAPQTANDTRRTNSNISPAVRALASTSAAPTESHCSSAANADAPNDRECTEVVASNDTVSNDDTTLKAHVEATPASVATTAEEHILLTQAGTRLEEQQATIQTEEKSPIDEMGVQSSKEYDTHEPVTVTLSRQHSDPNQSHSHSNGNSNSNSNGKSHNTVTTDLKPKASPPKGQVIIRRIVQETESEEKSAQEQARVIVHRITLEDPDKQDYKTDYQVESPQNVLYLNEGASAARGVQIQEISDESSGEYNDNPPLVSEAESEPETTPTSCDISLQTEPQDITLSPADSLTAEQEDTKKRNAQRRIALESHFLPQLLSPRYLDSITEENVSDMSDARSDCSDNPTTKAAATDTDAKAKRANAIFPKSHLDFSKTHKHGDLPKFPTVPGAICEEPVSIIVETKYIEETTAAESCCATISSAQTPQSEAAELVFITNSASSSISDLMELDLEAPPNEVEAHTANAVDLDTDVQKIIAKPVAAATTSASRESTPVNQVSNDEVSKLTEHAANSNVSGLSEIPERAHTIEPNVYSSAFVVLSAGGAARTDNITSNSEHSDADSYSSVTNGSTTETSETFETLTSSSSNSDSLRAEHVAVVETPPPSFVPLGNKSEMNNVREIVNAHKAGVAPVVASGIRNDDLWHERVEQLKRDSPPPIPPPPRHTDTFSAQVPTASYYSNNNNNSASDSFDTTAAWTEQTPPTYASPPSPTASSSSFQRQESADSHCSNSTNHSQCTAINVAASPHSDIDATYSLSDNCSTNSAAESPVKLRQLCTQTLASMPYGEEVLEELATVARNIQEVHAQGSEKMPYPLPDLPHIDDLQLSLAANDTNPSPSTQTVAIMQKQPRSSTSPPPLPEPPSRYNDAWLGVPTAANPQLLVCLSPSQRAYMSEHKTAINDRPDQLLDAHQKFVDRRGYHEYSAEQVQAMNNDKLEEQQILKTAALMKKLRKSLTPPPIPPPPVPKKSSQTAAKAQNQTKTTAPPANGNDASSRNANEQIAKAPLAVGEAEEQQNKQRLLEIIHDHSELKQNHSQKTTSSFENNSRQPTGKQGEPLQPAAQAQTSTPSIPPAAGNRCITAQSQAEIQNYTTSGSSNTHPEQNVLSATSTTKSSNYNSAETLTNPNQFPAHAASDNNMQSVESDLAKMFPSMGHGNIFDADRRRFSNIESSTRGPYCSQLMSTQPKRYSNIETHSYESKKRTENGQVVYDYATSKHEAETDGDKSASAPLYFPQKEIETSSSHPFTNNEASSHGYPVKGEYDEYKIKTTATPRPIAEEIMSASKLNTNNATTTSRTTTATTTESNSAFIGSEQPQDNRAQTNLSEEAQEWTRRADIKNRSENENTTVKKDISSTYEEFRQRAKAAADAVNAANATSAPPPTTAPAAPTFSAADKQCKSSLHFDHEKLFKDFDDLSKQLHKELETGREERVHREQSASLYDVSRVHFKNEFEGLKKQRHEHMQELEQEIDRSMRSRHIKPYTRQESAPSMTTTYETRPQHQSYTLPRTYEVPIRVENGSTRTSSGVRRNERQAPRVYEIPVQRAPTSNVPTTLSPQQAAYEDARFRRAESMFNLSDNTTHTGHNNLAQTTADDWSRYASDFGSSENIARPLAREVEICYQRSRPNTIRAPRLSMSTNDLSTHTSSAHTYDNYNAYNTRRTHAPMLHEAPQQSRPQYLSCHSMIERDPNPTYISTTTRRGVSPAPPTASSLPVVPAPPQSEQYRERRASLPREIHEQQLKHILSKEDELRNEFERLQNERQRLLHEMNRAPTMQAPQRPPRDVYRPAPKLPTLSEDEVFRQQMAEEWLNKVAEREERRLQKIIKISKLNEDVDVGHRIPIQVSHAQPDISQEFLSRVKERRSKLAMPSDSDWESGAESHPNLPQGQASESEDGASVKILEGRAEADLKQLPQHLREFAKFSNHEREQIDGGHREMHHEEERRQEANDNSISSAMKKSSVVKTFKMSRLPPTATSTTHSMYGRAPEQRQPQMQHPTHQQAQQQSHQQAQQQAYQQAQQQARAMPPRQAQGQVFADTETPWPTTSSATPPYARTIPTAPPRHSKPSASFGEMFATSPHRATIYEEFDNYWRNFNNTTNY